MSFACEFCSNVFSNKHTLSSHQKTARYCLKIQGEKLESALKCEYCDKGFTQKKTLDKHLSICKNKEDLDAINEVDQLKKDNNSLTKENNKLLAKNIKLQEKILSLEKDLAFQKGKLKGYEKVKPPTINNTICTNQYIHPKLKNIPIDNIKPLTLENIKLSLPDYTYDHFKKMERGIIEHFLSITNYKDENDVVNKNYVCTNKSRNTFYGLLKDTPEWTRDNGATYIHTYLDLLRFQTEDYAKRFDEEFLDIISEGDQYDIDFMKKIHDELLIFKTAVRGHPGQKYRDELLVSIRSGIRDRLSI